MTADVDCDHEVTGVDSLTILRWVANIATTTTGCEGSDYAGASPKGDVDCDGYLAADDALRILRYAAGLASPSTLTCS